MSPALLGNIDRATIMAFCARLAKPKEDGGYGLSTSLVNHTLNPLRMIPAKAAERFGLVSPMQTVKSLEVGPDLIPGRVLGGRFQVIWPFSSRARSGWRFATFELVLDSERTLRAYAWESECKGFHVPRHLARVYAAGRIRERRGRLELACSELIAEDPTPLIRAARERLRTLARSVNPAPLRELLRRVFRDPAIGPAFLIAPASLSYHHAFSGGLLVHSAQCAGMVHRWMEGEALQGLATTAALLHDIGKVRTLSGDMTRTPLGRLVSHDALTLEVLAPHLAWLDGEWPQGARMLRHLLTARVKREDPSPPRMALELVRTADRISAHRAPAGSGMLRLASARGREEFGEYLGEDRAREDSEEHSGGLAD